MKKTSVHCAAAFLPPDNTLLNKSRAFKYYFLFLFYVSALLLSAPLYAAPPLQELLSEAKTLREEGRIEEAYRLLLRHELEYAGTVDYDYLLGITALDARDAQMAGLALERVLILRPNDQQARLQLGRAHLRQRNDSAAAAVFKEILARSKDKKLRRRARRYLRLAQKRLALRQGIFSLRLNMEAGYDDNITADPDIEKIELPGGTYILPPNYRQQESWYAQSGVNGGYTYSVTPFSRLFANAALKYKHAFDLDHYDQSDFSIQGGAQIEHKKHNFLLGLQSGLFYLDHIRSYHYYGPYGNWRYTPREDLSFNVFSRYIRVFYAQRGNQISNYSNLLAGAGVSWNFRRHRFTFTLYGGNDEAENNRPDGDSGVWGGSGNADLFLSGKWRLKLGLLYQSKDYRRLNLYYKDYRYEQYWTAKFQLKRRIAKNVELSLQYSHTRNDSNLSLFAYDRNKTLLNWHYTF